MPKRDLNQIAASIVALSTGEEKSAVKSEPEKNQAAVALGRLGGLKGGKRRSEKLSAARKKEIAQNAARTRWAKRQS